MNKENKTCTSRRRRGTGYLNRQRLYQLVEEALESLVEKGQMERFFCSEDGKRHYRLREGCSIQEQAVGQTPPKCMK